MKNINILIIDDIQSNIYAIKSIIEHYFSTKIFTALSASEGFETLLNNKIDLIICDVQMPLIDGFEFASYINNIENLRNIPIILNSAVYEDKEIIRKIAELNIYKFLSKPIKEEELKSAIQNYDFTKKIAS